MSHSSNVAVYRSALANIGIAIFKIGGGIACQSSVMIGEGIHSIVDTLNQLLLLVGRWMAKKPASEKNPLGHHKAPFFFGVIIATFIFYMGSMFTGYEGIHSWMHPEPINYAPVMVVGFEIPRLVILLCIIIGAMAFEAWALKGAIDEVQEKFPGLSLVGAVRASKDPADIILVFEDTAALVGLTIAFVGVSMAYYTGNPLWDAGGTIMISVLLLVVSAVLLRKLYSLEIGESADPVTLERIRGVVLNANYFEFEQDGEPLRERPGIERINELVTIHHGPNQIIVLVSLDFKDKIGSKHIEALVSQIDRDLKEISSVIKVFVEAQNYVSHLDILNEDGDDDEDGEKRFEAFEPDTDDSTVANGTHG